MITRKVVTFRAAEVSRARLLVWATTRGFDLSRTYGGREIDPQAFDFHTTVIASETPVDMPIGEAAVPLFSARAVAFDRLGPEAMTPVLRIVSQGTLDAARAFYERVWGIVPTFSTFKPHVTVSYSWSGEPSLDELEPPDFPILFDRLRVDDLA